LTLAGVVVTVSVNLLFVSKMPCVDFRKSIRSVDGLGDGLGGNGVAGRRLCWRGSSDGLKLAN
jgi:hypothetical protein